MVWKKDDNQKPEVDPEIARMQRLNRLQDIDNEIRSAGSGTATSPDAAVHPDFQPLLAAIHATTNGEGVHTAIRQYLARQGYTGHPRRRI